jgi:non-ribosomal peptide synthetase component F
VCIPSEETIKSDLSCFIEFAKVNWALLTPRILRKLSPDSVPSLESLVSIGEPIDTKASKTWSAYSRFLNGWSACETSVLSTVADVILSPPYSESIGRLVACSIWIVIPETVHQLSPIGGMGEILVEGPGVARAYLNDEVRTAASFIPPPRWACRKETKFYRTGDLTKYNPDGSISFVG